MLAIIAGIFTLNTINLIIYFISFPDLMLYSLLFPGLIRYLDKGNLIFYILFDIGMGLIIVAGAAAYVKELSFSSIMKYLIIITLFSLLISTLISHELYLERGECKEVHGYCVPTEDIVKKAKEETEGFFSFLFWLPIAIAVGVKKTLIKSNMKK